MLSLNLITATYNTTQNLPGLVESLLTQSDMGFEWGVADGWVNNQILPYSKAPHRELLYVDNVAAASMYVISVVPERVVSTCSHINVGFGHDQSIRQVAELIAWER
ncbi:hypothetical protein ACIKP9_02260 [Methylobacillus methanolivorans]|uniref:Uncharacterized protein n=1 Tax=Methylobacillus methanolivorans TaxID=1848927 RepID=A0ABW8GI62_9PROT